MLFQEAAMNLRVPGPTPLPPEVLEAAGQQMVNHRGPEFIELLREVTSNLKSFFRTKEDVLVVTASGTGGMEAGLVNFLSPGDRVLAVIIGIFGKRFADIAEAYGADVTRLEVPWGQPAHPEDIERELSRIPDVRAVLVTHNETSTGVTNDLEPIARIVNDFRNDAGENPLLIVDAISSLGAIPFEMDAWGCDVVITGSQKAWMAPPGLSMIGVSKRAWQANKKAGMSRFYLDLATARRYAERGQTPYTPAVSALYGLQASLELMQEEGGDRIVARHRQVAQHCRDGIRTLGLDILAPESHASSTVTAVCGGDKVEDLTGLLSRLREEKGIVLAGGQGDLQGRIFRIGHLGYVYQEDVDDLVKAIGELL
jgi:aspartate aminotransferase-like enzyme